MHTDERRSAAELATEADVERLRRAQDARDGERHRIQCASIGCKRHIPDTKRPQSKYCSRKCSSQARALAITALKSEVTQQVRSLEMAGRTCSACKRTIVSRNSRGPLPKWCERCRKMSRQKRDSMIKRLALKQAGRMCEWCGANITVLGLGPIPRFCRDPNRICYSRSRRASKL